MDVTTKTSGQVAFESFYERAVKWEEVPASQHGRWEAAAKEAARQDGAGVRDERDKWKMVVSDLAVMMGLDRSSVDHPKAPGCILERAKTLHRISDGLQAQLLRIRDAAESAGLKCAGHLPKGENGTNFDGDFIKDEGADFAPWQEAEGVRKLVDKLMEMEAAHTKATAAQVALLQQAEERSKVDGPAYNSGRSEGHADVAARLRAILDPKDVEHLGLEGLIHMVEQLEASARKDSAEAGEHREEVSKLKADLERTLHLATNHGTEVMRSHQVLDAAGAPALGQDLARRVEALVVYRDGLLEQTLELSREAGALAGRVQELERSLDREWRDRRELALALVHGRSAAPGIRLWSVEHPTELRGANVKKPSPDDAGTCSAGVVAP